MFVEIISAILRGGFVLFLVPKSLAVGLLTISASINSMAEAAKLACFRETRSPLKDEW